jgi:DNA-binding phage protein
MPSTKTTAKTVSMPLDTHVALAAAIAKSQKTKSQFAHCAGMDSSGLQKYLRPDGPNMTTATLTRVLEANGIKARLVFEQ